MTRDELTEKRRRAFREEERQLRQLRREIAVEVLLEVSVVFRERALEDIIRNEGQEGCA